MGRPVEAAGTVSPNDYSRSVCVCVGVWVWV